MSSYRKVQFSADIGPRLLEVAREAARLAIDTTLDVIEGRTQWIALSEAMIGDNGTSVDARRERIQAIREAVARTPESTDASRAQRTTPNPTADVFERTNVESQNE